MSSRTQALGSQPVRPSISVECRRPLAPWGKSLDGEIHHLAHHCADVAACFEAIVALPVVRARLEYAAGRRLSSTDIGRLALLAFLHDAGKLHPGFQAKGWPDEVWHGRHHGHVHEGAAIFLCDAPEAIARNLHLESLIAWGVDQHLLYSVLAHHGRPIKRDRSAGHRWQPAVELHYDPILASAEIGAVLPGWFPRAFRPESDTLPDAADFQHLLCGLVSLADWLGSTREIFGFVPGLDPGYMTVARRQAREAVTDIGLDTRLLRDRAAGRTDFATLTGGSDPFPHQALVGASSLDENLLILEAETGSGKTEAALWRFVRLFEAGLVDSLYFALPTRAAAVQLHRRVHETMKRVFDDNAPETVLVVPGYLRAGDSDGRRLPKWEVRWDDDDGFDEKQLRARWAAESTKRSLAAMVGVGTVDQVMLASLQVKHAHLRGAALSRSLLVVDEVHASDRYMTEVQAHLLRMHLGRRGHAMLMSATLGSVARAKWLEQTPPPSYASAVAEPYPAVWANGRRAPSSSMSFVRQKQVAMTLLSGMAAEVAAAEAIQAARAGARVLIIRNTVSAAVMTYDCVLEARAEHLLLQVAGGPALHHGRFAPEDRRRLDAAIETVLSPRERASGGVIVIGTQTLEQSLDIDADILITDLCPSDVLLQRIGRLHRHPVERPVGFRTARCLVMVPEGGLHKLLAPKFENGLGAWVVNGVPTGIYTDLSGLELTRRLVLSRPVWTIPAMNRLLVEGATHPERIEELHMELGQDWASYRNDIDGRALADAGAAKGVALPFDTPFADVDFPGDEERIRTRLGAEGACLVLPTSVIGPFAGEIRSVTLPAHWSQDIHVDLSVTVEAVMAKGGRHLRIRTGDTTVCYGRRGLMREVS